MSSISCLPNSNAVSIINEPIINEPNNIPTGNETKPNVSRTTGLISKICLFAGIGGTTAGLIYGFTLRAVTIGALVGIVTVPVAIVTLLALCVVICAIVKGILINLKNLLT